MKLLLAQLAPAGNDGSGGLHVEPGEGDRDDDDLVFESRHPRAFRGSLVSARDD